MISQSQVIQVYLPLRYLPFSFCGVKRYVYVQNERDKMAVEPDPDQIYTLKRKKRMNLMSSFPLAESASVKYYISAPLRSVKYEHKTI